MRVYCGERDRATGRVTRVFVVDTETERSYDIVERPVPDTEGLEWGYAGTGPHNLARAILDDFLGRIPDWVGQFEDEIVADPRNKGKDFMLSASRIEIWMARKGLSEISAGAADP